MQTVVGINCCNLWNCLCKRNVNCLFVVQVHVKVIRNLFVRTLFYTFAAACTLCFINIAGVTFNINLEVSDITLYTNNLAVRKDADVRILAYFCHFRSNNTGSTVKGRECLIKHGHLTTDSRLFLYDIYREACIGNIKGSCNSGNTTTNYKGSFCYRSFSFD